jgi:hypothetical protein
MKDKLRKTSVTLYERQIDWFKKNHINISSYVRDVLEDKIRGVD